MTEQRFQIALSPMDDQINMLRTVLNENMSENENCLQLTLWRRDLFKGQIFKLLGTNAIRVTGGYQSVARIIGTSSGKDVKVRMYGR